MKLSASLVLDTSHPAGPYICKEQNGFKRKEERKRSPLGGENKN